MLQAMNTGHGSLSTALASADAKMSVAGRSWRIQDGFMEIPENRFVWNSEVSVRLSGGRRGSVRR
jgi:hypothetical protein